MTITPLHRRMFGIDWWPARFHADCRTQFAPDGVTVRATFEPVGPLIKEHAEWWRRWGYAVVRWLPRGER